jgi:ion channel-forming bestrophin family protein
MNRSWFNWFQIALQLRGSVIPAVMPKAIFCGAFGVVISLLAHWKYVTPWTSLGNVIPSIVLGLLLVFRTNTAYERFWEGRKAWGTLVNTVRNLTRRIWIFVEESEHLNDGSAQNVHRGKVAALRSIVAFSVAMKQHLRKEFNDTEFKELLNDRQCKVLQQAPNPPLQIAFWIESFLLRQQQHSRVDLYQLTTLNALLDNMVDALGACERILKTPMPLAYAIHLKQLLLIYCLLLPMQMVGELNFLTGPIVALVAFTLFGIEEIGIEIENPFGRDFNDLPLDDICQSLNQYVDHLISLPSGVGTDIEETYAMAKDETLKKDAWHKS